jgi:hypothetical protein
VSFKQICLVCGYTITSEHEPKILYCPNCKNIRENKFDVVEDDEPLHQNSKTVSKIELLELRISRLEKDFDKLLVVLNLKKKEKVAKATK